MEYRVLGKTNLRVSKLGFGASSLGGVFHSFDEHRGIDAVFTAVDEGINFIDVSPYYGYYKAETVLGKALKDIPHEKFILSTKVGRYGEDGHNTWDYSAERVTRSVYESMERLHIDFVDILYVHDIEFADLNQIPNETLPALHRLCPSAQIGCAVLEVEVDRSAQGMRRGLEFRPSALLQATHAAEHHRRILRQLAAHLIGQTSVADHLTVHRLNMSRRIEDQRTALAQGVQRDAGQLAGSSCFRL
jgi:aryl-alcohol dehydrogenase-like predicted oxidoreductase